MSNVKTTETALERITDVSNAELEPSRGQTEVMAEIAGAIRIAKAFPRNEDAAFERLMKSCRRTSFAEEVNYGFPRGGDRNCRHEWDWDIERCTQCNATLVNGPSVNLAREAARVWGNNSSGMRVVTDTEESRQIECWAWDMETNRKVAAQTQFSKLVYRKGQGWIAPDERDLRELTNRHAAILVRNCILEILPKDLIEDACKAAVATILKNATEDPEGQRKAIILGFSELNISVDMLEGLLGHKVAASSPAELAKLKAIYKSIGNGASTWNEYTNLDSKVPDKKTPAKEPQRANGASSAPEKQADKQPADKNVVYLNKTEIGMVVAFAKKAAMDDEKLTQWLFGEFQIDGGPGHIPQDQLDKVCNALVAKKSAEAKEQPKA